MVIICSMQSIVNNQYNNNRSANEAVFIPWILALLHKYNNKNSISTGQLHCIYNIIIAVAGFVIVVMGIEI